MPGVISADPSKTLVRRNLAALRKHHPELAAALKTIKQPVTVAELDDAGIPCNICIGSERLYAAPARKWADGQVTGFFADNQRILFEDAQHCNLSDFSLPFYRKVVDFCCEEGPEHVSNTPMVDVGYLFIFGVGLGFHIERLLLETPARNLVLIEPETEFLLHSLSAIDWSRLFRLAKKHGKKLHFALAKDPEAITRSMEYCLVREGSAFLDGSYFYFHYYSWPLKEAFVQFSLKVRHHFMSTGFFEDEKRMMTNACRNMRLHDYYLCEDKPFFAQSTPVFIVGSGPSLDNDIEYIRMWRHKVVLVSCGTSLGILLKHGLRPDIHAEMENGPQIYPILAPLKEKYGFQGIRLAASLTVDHNVCGLFESRWFFLRTALSPSRLLARFHKGLVGSDPTVANAGFSVIAVSGFKNVYLFGIDCGYREGSHEKHHSRDSIYFSENCPESTEDIVSRHDRQLPGNFGGTFFTQWTFDMTGRAISEIKRQNLSMNLFNCADGARIEGALPKAAEALDFSHLPDRHERLLEQVERQMAYYKPGELIRKFDREQLVAGCHVFGDAVIEALATSRRKKDGFWEMRERLNAVYAAHAEECLGVIAIAGAALLNMTRAAAFYGVRFSDPKRRRKLLDFVAVELEQSAGELARLTAEFLEGVLADEDHDGPALAP